MPCIILKLTGIPCPTCGTTRAMISLIKGNINDYLEYQPFALPLVIAVITAICMKAIRNKKLARAYIYIVIFSNFIYYLFKLARWFFL